jgi:cytochrome c5
MLRFLLPAVVLITACSETADDRDAAPARELLTGQAAYEEVCSDCHDEGKDGAPAVGDRDAWADRSSLWTAVLEEHAKNGYLDMPAKGGEPGLTDQEVSAAAAYMMSLTHPDRPPE